MKLIISKLAVLAVILITVASSSLKAQPLGISSDLLTAFVSGGYFTENLQDGTFEVAYIGCKPIKSKDGTWGAGIYFMYTNSNFQDYIVGAYKGRERSFEEGIQATYYEAMERVDVFISMNIGGKYSADNGEAWHNQYQGWQKNISLTWNLNANLIKKAGLFPRTQFLVSANKSVEEMANGSWQGDPIKNSSPWRRNGIELLLKSSLIDCDLKPVFELNKNLLLSPKLLLGAVYEESYASAYKIGGELSLHRRGKDDMVAAYFTAKLRPYMDAQFTVGVNVGINNF